MGRSGQLLITMGFGLVGVACLSTRFLREEEHGKAHDRDAHRVWSGKTFKEQTRVDRTPSPSALSAGFDAERVWSGYDDWEPAIAADPSSQSVYQLTTRYGATDCQGCPSAVIALRQSTDGGATWEADQYFIDSVNPQWDPQLEVANDGTLYAVFMLNYHPGVMFSRSRDHGQTWTTPIPVSSSKYRPVGGDKPALVISPDGRDVYVGFNNSHAYIAASHDYGDSFAPPVKTNKDLRYWYHYQGAVAPDGTVYFAAVDYTQDFTGTQDVDVISSSDGGKSWTTTRIDSSGSSVDCPWSQGCYYGFFAATVALAIDPAGTIMFAYNASDADGEPTQLYVRTSNDGIHWSERQQVSMDDPEVNNVFPVLAAGPTPGDFRLVWQDDRMGSTVAWNTWYLRTQDGGQTWEDEVRLSDQATGAPYKSAAGYAFPYGDYYEMAVDSRGTAHIIWGEGAAYDGPGGSWYTRGQ